MIHLAIHDVSPRWEAEVERALGFCHAIGARPGLLVVPDMHGRCALADHPAFCRRLRALADAGHEVFLHGYHHRAPPGDGAWWFLTQRVVSAGEAEFAALERAAGEALLDRGLRELRALDLPVHGFVPPAWARRRWLLPALRERGLPFTEDQLWVYQPVTGARRLCPAINYASRTPARRASSVAYARIARGYVPLGLSVRVAIHPADLHHGTLVRETRSLLEWSRGRTTDRAADLFE